MKDINGFPPALRLFATVTRGAWPLVGGVAVFVLGGFAMAATIAWSLTEADATGDEVVVRASPPLVAVNAQGRARCPECGVVSSTRSVDHVVPSGAPGPESANPRTGQGKAAGRIPDSYEVTVNMTDGSRRVFIDSGATNWRPGERMIVIGGADPSLR